MLKLVIIADDFTGALDTSVHFAEKGIETRVVIDPDFDFSEVYDSADEVGADIDAKKTLDAEKNVKADTEVETEVGIRANADAVVTAETYAAADDAQVLVIDTETRHMTPSAAYQIIYGIVRRAQNSGAEYFYKKTDSALRGCVGSELSAMLDASGACQLVFLPAFPKQHRTTLGGVQYLDGIPIHESVFGKDPFEPTRHSYIPDLIGEQSDTFVEVISTDDTEAFSRVNSKKSIMVFDAVTDEDMSRTANLLQANRKLSVMAGCAGFARILPELIEFEQKKHNRGEHAKGLVVICGSLNPITQTQIIHALDSGFHGFHLTPEQKLQPDYLSTTSGLAFMKSLSKACSEHKRIVVDTFGENAFELANDYAIEHGISQPQIRELIAQRLGSIAAEIAKHVPDYALMLTGGDTLLGFMRQINCTELQPIKEISSGVVLSHLNRGGKRLKIITKSGGFGNSTILDEIANELIR